MEEILLSNKTCFKVSPGLICFVCLWFLLMRNTELSLFHVMHCSELSLDGSLNIRQESEKQKLKSRKFSQELGQDQS